MGWVGVYGCAFAVVFWLGGLPGVGVALGFGVIVGYTLDFGLVWGLIALGWVWLLGAWWAF